MDTSKFFSLEGRVALITGGSRGIGKMIAAGYHRAGREGVHFVAQGPGVRGNCRRARAELHSAADGRLDRRRLQGARREDGRARGSSRHPGQQCRRRVGRAVRGIPRKRLGQGDGPQRQVALLPDAGAARHAQGTRELRPPEQGHQHHLDRRPAAQSVGNVQLSRVQIGADLPHQADGRAADQGRDHRAPASPPAPSPAR